MVTPEQVPQCEATFDHGFTCQEIVYTRRKLQQAAYEDGVMIRVSGNNAIFSPPLIVTSDNVTKILSAVETGLKAVSG